MQQAPESRQSGVIRTVKKRAGRNRTKKKEERKKERKKVMHFTRIIIHSSLPSLPSLPFFITYNLFHLSFDQVFVAPTLSLSPFAVS